MSTWCFSVSSSPRLRKSASVCASVSRVVPIISASSCCVSRASMSVPREVLTPNRWRDRRACARAADRPAGKPSIPAPTRRREAGGKVADDVDPDGRVALHEGPQLLGADGADDRLIEQFGEGLGNRLLTQQRHITKDRALVVDVERELLAIGRDAVDADLALLEDVDRSGGSSGDMMRWPAVHLVMVVACPMA